ncbi:MAG: ACP phosphodiesterase [Draconibacterium sp.]
MNYLAHLYLSGDNEKTLVGNFIGDYIKGNAYQSFPESIQSGILLHRQIDTYTDSHPNFKVAKSLFREEFGLYSGIIIDFFYDHFLASNWNKYSDLTLRNFAKKAHAILLSNFTVLPLRVQGFLPFLIQNRRLESYANISGILESVKIMSKYSSLPDKTEIAGKLLIDNYDLLSENFSEFMTDIISFVSSYHKINLKKPDVTEGA